MSLADVAKLIIVDGNPVNRATISRLENGSRKLTMEWAQELSTVFRCSVSEVFGDDDADFMDGAWLAAEIEKRGLVKADLARALETSPQTVTYILAGERRISKEDAIIIRQWLDTAQPKQSAPRTAAPASGVPVYALERQDDGFHRSRVAVRYMDVSNVTAGRGVFAEVYPMTTDMAPRYESGDVILVDPNRAPRAGEYVRLETTDGVVMYRRFLGVGPDGFRVESTAGGGSPMPEDSVKAIGTVVGTVSG
jgi:plasmid maintenance system antidote protein VapI